MKSLEADIDISFLHIGKTGGNSIKDYWSLYQPQASSRLTIHPHMVTMADILKDDATAKISFVFRDPTARFISGFNSRLRCGRPKNNGSWRVEEAISFKYFETPQALAHALGGQDERLYSAAQFAMENISHLRRNYQFYFGSVSKLKKIQSNIAFASDLNNLEQNYTRLFSLLGDVPDGGWPQLKRLHVSTKESYNLSTDEEAALRNYWAKEYKIYDWLSARYF